LIGFSFKKKLNQLKFKNIYHIEKFEIVAVILNGKTC